MNKVNLVEKLESSGVGALSSCELLSLVLDDSRAADSLNALYPDLSRLLSGDFVALRSVDGVGAARAARLLAALELGRRCAVDGARERVEIFTSQDVVNLFRPRVAALPHEECWVLYLNGSNRILEEQCLSRGGLDSTVVDPRLVVKRALELLATKIVLVHNHPSGSLEPSSADVYVTKRIRDAAALFEISLLDHVIISCDGDFSLFAAGLL